MDHGKKAVWSGKSVSEFISPLEADQINPNGVDLRVSEILKNTSPGLLGKERELCERSEIKAKNGVYELSRGSYISVYRENVVIPENAIGLVLPRSSLMRMGAMLFSAVWDSGYEGRGEGLLVVHNEEGIHICENARIAQMIFFSANASGKYEGTYKGERIGERRENSC